MPVLQVEIQSFVQTWNIHHIQKQPYQPTVVHGKPFINYFHPADGVQDLGIPVNHDAWENMQSTLQDWGSYIIPSFFSFFFFWIVHILTQGIDINEFLPEATFNWCRTQLLEMAFDPIHPPKIPGVEHSTPFHTIYLQFREIVSTHIASDADPVLELSKAPQRPTSMTSWAARD